MKIGHEDPTPKKFANVDPIPVDNPHADPNPENIEPEISIPEVFVNQTIDIKVKDTIECKEIPDPYLKDLNPEEPAEDNSALKSYNSPSDYIMEDVISIASNIAG